MTGFNMELLETLNEEERSAWANLICPAVALEHDESPEVREAAVELLRSAETTLLSRRNLERVLARAAGEGNREALRELVDSFNREVGGCPEPELTVLPGGREGA